MVLKYIRFFFITILFFLVGLLGTLFSLLRPFHPHNAFIFARLLGKPGLWILGLRSRIENHEGLYKPRPCVFISNHQHNLDILPCAQWMSPGTVSLGKKSIRKIPFFGQFYWLSGNVLIDRNNKKSALQTMDQAAEAINKRNLSIWMMPEGTRHKGPGVKAFKKGPFYTAIKAQVPIVPVAINRYSDRLNFSHWVSGEMLARVYEPISTAGMGPEDVDALMERCYQIVSNGVAELENKHKS